MYGAQLIPALAILGAIAAAALGYWLGRRNAAGDVAETARKNEAEADAAAELERARIEAETQEKLAKIPSETTEEIAKDLWGSAEGGVLTVDKRK